MGFSFDSVVKNPPANPGYTGSIPGLGESPREENGKKTTPVFLEWKILENPMNRAAWLATVYGVAKESDTN